MIELATLSDLRRESEEGRGSMENLRASRLRTLMTVAAGGAILVAGLTVSPSAGAEETTVGPPGRGPYTPCIADGETFGEGIPVGSAPLRWKYRGTPYAGARYDGCANTVTLYYGGSPMQPGLLMAHYYNVKWTLSPNGVTTTYDSYASGSRKKTLTATHISGYTTYTVQVRACVKPPSIGLPGGLTVSDTCTPWSPIVYLTYLR